MKPDDTHRRLAQPGIKLVLRRRFNLPAIGCALGNHKRERSFCKLNKSTPVVSSGHEDLTRNFRRAAFGLPNGLTLAHDPTGLFKADWGQSWNRLTTGE